MSEKPEKKSAAFQSDAFQAESAAPKSPRRLRAVAWVRGTIFGLVPFLARVPRQVLAGIGALLILFGTVYEWRKPPAPINSPSPRLLGWIWWANPRQLNPERTLPAFDHANIQSVEVVPKSSRVWIAGDAGLLAYSDDGTNWTTFHYDPVTGTMVKDVPVGRDSFASGHLARGSGPIASATADECQSASFQGEHFWNDTWHRD